MLLVVIPKRCTTRNIYVFAFMQPQHRGPQCGVVFVIQWKLCPTPPHHRKNLQVGKCCLTCSNFLLLPIVVSTLPGDLTPVLCNVVFWLSWSVYRVHVSLLYANYRHNKVLLGRVALLAEWVHYMFSLVGF